MPRYDIKYKLRENDPTINKIRELYPNLNIGKEAYINIEGSGDPEFTRVSKRNMSIYLDGDRNTYIYEGVSWKSNKEVER